MTNKPMKKYSIFFCCELLRHTNFFLICKGLIYHNDIDLLSDIKVASIFHNLAFAL